MPLTSALYFTAVCDCCGYADDDEYSAWAQADYALDRVRDADGLVLGGLWRVGRPLVILCHTCAFDARRDMSDELLELVDDARWRDGLEPFVEAILRTRLMAGGTWHA